MIYLKTPQDMEKMRRAAELTSRTMGFIASHVDVGVTTASLDALARQFIHDNGGVPACLGYNGFPGAVCIEVNDVIVHGFPSGYQLKSGDIVGVDLVVELDGFNGDMCYTFAVGDVDPKIMDLCRTTKESLQVGIDACRAGHRLGDVSNAIQNYCERRGYSVVREMCGHGIGRSMHEDPEVPNYGRRGTGPVIRNGMCLCIEPMVNLGSRNIVIERDGWTCRTKDRKPSAHYEHTLAIVDGQTEVLTTFDYIHQAVGDRFIAPAGDK